MRSIGMCIRIVVTGLVLAIIATIVSVARPAHAGIHTSRLWVSDHGVVQHSTLPHCEYEDGSYTHLPTPHMCTWNIGPGRDGDGRGIAYWFGWQFRPVPGPITGVDRVAHYVWDDDPTVGSRWRWVSSGLADALAEGQWRHDRDWTRCVTRLVHHGQGWHRWVKCPNGQLIRTGGRHG